jgi:hypothetical protein
MKNMVYRWHIQGKGKDFYTSVHSSSLYHDSAVPFVYAMFENKSEEACNHSELLGFWALENAAFNTLKTGRIIWCFSL